LKDVNIQVSVELGRTCRMIKEILSMGEGTIVELDKLAGEPVDILANNKPIAKGEVVVIDENFGVRITELLDVQKYEKKEESCERTVFDFFK
jgi:flagellar motor switch protein FliN/FliY